MTRHPLLLAQFNLQLPARSPSLPLTPVSFPHASVLSRLLRRHLHDACGHNARYGTAGADGADVGTVDAVGIGEASALAGAQDVATLLALEGVDSAVELELGWVETASRRCRNAEVGDPATLSLPRPRLGGAAMDITLRGIDAAVQAEIGRATGRPLSTTTGPSGSSQPNASISERSSASSSPMLDFLYPTLQQFDSSNSQELRSHQSGSATRHRSSSPSISQTRTVSPSAAGPTAVHVSRKFYSSRATATSRLPPPREATPSSSDELGRAHCSATEGSPRPARPPSLSAPFWRLGALLRQGMEKKAGTKEEIQMEWAAKIAAIEEAWARCQSALIDADFLSKRDGAASKVSEDVDSGSIIPLTRPALLSAATAVPAFVLQRTRRLYAGPLLATEERQIHHIWGDRLLSMLDACEGFDAEAGPIWSRRIPIWMLRTWAFVFRGDMRAAVELVESRLTWDGRAERFSTAASPQREPNSVNAQSQAMSSAVHALLFGWEVSARWANSNAEQPYFDAQASRDEYATVSNPPTPDEITTSALRWIFSRWDMLEQVIHSSAAVVSAHYKLIAGLSSATRFLDDNISDRPLDSTSGALAKTVTGHESSSLGIWSSLSARGAAFEIIFALCNRGSAVEAMNVYDFIFDKGVQVPEHVTRKLVRYLSFEKELELANRVWARMRSLWSDDSNAAPQTSSRLSSTKHAGLYFQPSTYRLGVWVQAKQGRVNEVESLLEEMEAGPPSVRPSAEFTFRSRLLAYSERGDVAECLALWQKRFGGSDTQAWPNVKEYGRLIVAYGKRDDLDGASRVLSEMSTIGIEPDRVIFNVFLDAFARRVDVPSALAVVDKMRAAGIPPNRSSYNTLLHMFSLRKDPASARQTMATMRSDGLYPDRLAWTAYMDANVEAGQWDEALEVYKFLRSRRNRALRPNIATCNTLLKAYVLRGAPAQTVLDVFHGIKDLDLEPNMQTYTLLLLSTADAGAMDVAEDIFMQIVRRGDEVPLGTIKPNLYTFSVMIHGWLRLGQRSKAKAYYDEMKRRGIEPSPVTYGLIVTAYIKSGSEVNFKLARDIVQSLIGEQVGENDMGGGTLIGEQVGEDDVGGGTTINHSRTASWDSPALSQGPPFEAIFTPIINAYAKRLDPGMAEAFFRDMLNLGSQTSIASFTTLLDAYRRVGDVDSAKQVWNKLYSFAINITREPTSPAPADRRALADGSHASTSSLDPSRRNLLCLPLSVMIDALSQAGLHEDVARLWSRVRSDGFGFDSHNWNHLAVALINAGRVDDAFKVVENVLTEDVAAPWSSQSSIWQRSSLDGGDRLGMEEAEAREGSRLEEDESDSSTGDEPDLYGERSSNRISSPSRPPNRRSQVRADDDISSEEAAKSVAELGSHAKSSSRDERSRLRTSTPPDLGAAMAEQQIVGLARSMWYPHFNTLHALSRALEKLAQGRPVQRIGPWLSGDGSPTEESWPASETSGRERKAGTREQALALYEHLLRTYPNTVGAVAGHREKERTRLEEEKDRLARESGGRGWSGGL